MASLTASLALLTPRRKYSSTTITCTIRSSILKIIRLHGKVFKSKRLLKPQQVWNLGIGDFHSSTMFYMAYYSMIPRRQLSSEGKCFDSTTMRSCEHYITNHMIESCFAAFHKKRNMKHSGKLTMVCAELTNSDPNLGINSEDLATFSQRWFLTLSPTLCGVTPIKFTVTSSSKHWDIFI